jgi:hypothetical protein
MSKKWHTVNAPDGRGERMDIKGVCYDAGRVYGGRFLTRPVFDPATTGRELQIIRDDLHCNAVRFQGRDITRLMTAAACALELGLQVWLSPEMFEQTRERRSGAIKARASRSSTPSSGTAPTAGTAPGTWSSAR